MLRQKLKLKSESLINDIKEVKRIALENKLTNEQWFIDFEDQLNQLSGIEVINTCIELFPKLTGTAEERLNKWIQYKNY